MSIGTEATQQVLDDRSLDFRQLFHHRQLDVATQARVPTNTKLCTDGSHGPVGASLEESNIGCSRGTARCSVHVRMPLMCQKLRAFAYSQWKEQPRPLKLLWIRTVIWKECQCWSNKPPPWVSLKPTSRWMP